MNPLQQLLLIPLLAPLLAVLLLGAINPRPAVALRLLIWTSPVLPLGGWIAAAGATGAGLSALATVLALRQQAAAGQRPIAPAAGGAEPPPRRPGSTTTGASGPSRSPGDPAPTVEVPFRVIRRGSASPAKPTPEPATEAATAKAVGDGWDQPLSDHWD